MEDDINCGCSWHVEDVRADSRFKQTMNLVMSYEETNMIRLMLNMRSRVRKALVYIPCNP